MLGLMSTSSGEGTLRPDYDSPSGLKLLLEGEGLAMSKKFGQNFLTDRVARERLVAAVQAGPGTEVWEIGPGIGAMTAMLLDSGASVKAFEIDHGFARILSRSFGAEPGFTLVEGDFLKTWRAHRGAAPAPEAPRAEPEATRAPATSPARIFGNLPYNVASAIVADLLESEMIPPRMIFTVQKEAALRMAAVPGSKDYSAFSVLCTSACDVKILFDLGAYSFWPRPRVTSSVVQMTPRRVPLGIGERRAFSKFVRAMFASRRKTMRNNLGGWTSSPGAAAALDSILAALGKKPDLRAEALTPAELHAVYSALVLEARGSVQCAP